MTAWSEATVDSIIEDVRGSIAVDPDAPGGTAPDRLRRNARASGIRLWNVHDWDWRRVPGTLSVTVADSDIDVPGDFGKLDVKWMKEQDNGVAIRFYSDARRWQHFSNQYASDATGPPQHAFVRTKTSATGFEYEFKVVPTPDASYSFPYIYLLRDPWSHPTAESRLVDTASPQWPADWDEGWRLLAIAMAYFQFMPGSGREQRASGVAKAWINAAMNNLNETITGGDTEDRIESGYGDELASVASQYGFPIGFGYRDSGIAS